jgi:hypothetical protein
MLKLVGKPIVIFFRFFIVSAWTFIAFSVLPNHSILTLASQAQTASEVLDKAINGKNHPEAKTSEQRGDIIILKSNNDTLKKDSSKKKW